MLDILVRYLHFLGIFTLSGTLISEFILVENHMSPKRLRKLVKIDAVFGASAVLTLAAGLLLWLAVGKPAEFYTSNGLFHAKLTLFVVIALMSLYPTVFFIKNRKAQGETIEVPSSVRWLIRLELFFLLFMPLLGVLIAKGGGR